MNEQLQCEAITEGETCGLMAKTYIMIGQISYVYVALCDDCKKEFMLQGYKIERAKEIK